MPDYPERSITSFENIAGTIYERQRPTTFIHFFEDGTFHGSEVRDQLMDRPFFIEETRFEGTKLFLNQIKGPCDDNPDAIYEIHLLENGNLELVAIEDTCAIRSSTLSVEWVPVP